MSSRSSCARRPPPGRALGGKPKARKAIAAAADAARRIAEAAEPSAAVNLSVVELAHALEAAAGAKSLQEALALSSTAMDHAGRARAEIDAERAGREAERIRQEAEREEEDTIALLLAA
jgi:hypothetical protein